MKKNMNLKRILFWALALLSFSSFAQPVNNDRLPIYSIKEWFQSVLPQEFHHLTERPAEAPKGVSWILDSSYTYLAHGISGVWKDDRRSYFTYDDKENQIEVFTQDWNEINKYWENYYQRKVTYNSAGKILTRLDYRWSVVSDQFIQSDSTLYEYDHNENNVKNTAWRWDIHLLQWIFDFQEICEFYSDGTVKKSEFYRWNDINTYWEPLTKIEIIHAADHYEEIQYNWRPDLGIWQPWQKNIVETNAFKNIVNYYIQKWDALEEEFIDKSLINYTYTNFNKPKEINELVWKSNEWSPYARYLYYYNNNLDISKSEDQFWLNSTQGWENVSRSDYQYDSAGNRVNTIYYSWNNNLKEWQKGKNIKDYYSQSITSNSVDGEIVQYFIITPNPATQFISLPVKSREVCFYSLSGVFLQKRMVSSEKIDISNLPNYNFYIVVALNNHNEKIGHGLFFKH